MFSPKLGIIADLALIMIPVQKDLVRLERTEKGAAQIATSKACQSLTQ